MKYTWSYLQKNPKQVKRLLGISYEELNQLIEICRSQHEENQKLKENKKVRLIRAGGGKQPNLILEEQIILTLIYLRQGLTFQVLGLLFEVSESTAHNTFNYWQRVFREVLPASLMETIKKLEIKLEDFQEELEKHELIVDSSEQARERPLDYQEQKEYYSGKKKNHTLKTQFIILPKGKDIVDVVVGYPGPKSDIKLFQEHKSIFSVEQTFSGDKAYVGDNQITTPEKKPKNGELTSSQKEVRPERPCRTHRKAHLEENKKLSSQRIFVEHMIRLVKVFQVGRDRFRLRVTRYKSIILTLCGLVRLRLGQQNLVSLKGRDRAEGNDLNISQFFQELLGLGDSKPYDLVIEEEISPKIVCSVT
jgi:hypothetical protein